MEKIDTYGSPYDHGKVLLSCAILEKPRKVGDRIEKGAVILNECDATYKLLPELKDYFYVIERRGWYGKSTDESSDIKLVDDLQTLEETRRRFPYMIFLTYANADFVNTDKFYPLHIPKPFTGIQVSAWQEFKRHDLFVRAAKLLPSDRFIKFGHFWGPEGGSGTEHDLRKETMALAESIGVQNIDFAFTGAKGGAHLPDSSEEMNVLINMAKVGILTTRGEGVNRFKMECLAADIPVLVPNDVPETTKKHITKETGLLFEPTPEGLAEAISYVREHPHRFSPRKYLLRHSGIHKAVKELRKSLQILARRDGGTQQFENVTWDGRNQSLIWGNEACIDALRSAIQNASSLHESPSLS